MTTETKAVAIEAAGEITEEFIARCERHLTQRHITLWGQAWDISDPARRRVAAEWLASEVVSLMIHQDE